MSTKLLTRPEVALRLRMSVWRVDALRRKGSIPFVKVAGQGRIKYLESDINQLIQPA